jgi:hypothetical protein
MQFSQKFELKPALFTSQISNFRDNFSQNQEAKASAQLSEKNHWGNSPILGFDLQV